MKYGLLITGILLSTLFFYACKDAKKDNVEVSVKGDKALKIAYVNIDTMQEGLDLFQEKKKEFTQQEKAINEEISRLQRDIQNTAQNFQNKIQNRNISEQEAQQTQRKLENMQVNLQKKNESLGSSFMEKQAKFNEEFTKMIDEFFLEYNKDKGYDFILTQGPVKSVLYHDPKYDITQDVIKEMNVWIKNRKTDKVLENVVSDTAKKSDTSK